MHAVCRGRGIDSCRVSRNNHIRPVPKSNWQTDSVRVDIQARIDGRASQSAESKYTVFAHLTAEKAVFYRAIMEIFSQSKARFIIHLRPADVDRQLKGDGFAPSDTSSTELALQQLVAWGNLEAHSDTAEVATVQGWWRVRNLYQLSTEGEAAEAALVVFEQSIHQPGELQAAALDDIRRQLDRLVELSRHANPDDGDVSNTLLLLRQRFEELTAQAQRFIGGLQRRIELQGLNVDAFLAYKQRLIDYLERFLSQLVLTAHEIALTIRSIEPHNIVPLLHRMAERELIDRLFVTDEDRAVAQRAWELRWLGLCAWFVGTDDHPSQAEELRGAARAAIPSLVAAVTGINDRRAGRSDRAADLRTLAVWFAQAPDDPAAHRLWRCAFALQSCRHLSVDTETLEQRETDPVPSLTPWVNAPPLRISPRLHSSGRYVARGRPSVVIDRSADKARLAEFAAEENQQIEQWRQQLATGRRVRLSHLEALPDGAFQLFLDLLGDALAAKAGPDEPMSAASSDGALQIDLEPIGDGVQAVIRTTTGALTGDDHYLTIRRTSDRMGAESNAPGLIEQLAGDED